jgi:UDP-N-acetylmuramoyl-L-alanyl-D-glutamate--2,6-diaminopimelate ligase
VKLGELLAGLAVNRIVGTADVEVAGLCYDSRQAKPGYVFFSTARDKVRGRANIEDAFKRGARVVVADEVEDAATRPALTFVECERPRLLMGAVASRFYDAPSRRLELVGVTGTAGKTTTTYILASIFEAAGLPAGVIGTIGIFARDRTLYHGLTTPESIDFESSLAEMEREGIRHVASEVSSIGLAEGRVDELSFGASMFTNLGRDHLDYHGTMENYFAAKLRFFTDILPRSKSADPIAVVRGDDPYGKRILDATKTHQVSFGLDRALDAHPETFSAGLGGISATISVLGKKIEIHSPLIGELNLLNILGASALSVALGIDAAAVAEGVRRCPGAPGRMEAVPAIPGVSVLVDYAHKPDALEAVLKTLRSLCKGRLICVFGCGGDRDRGKRPIMGEIAGRIADLPVLTSDNPRTEDPLKIIAEVEQGLVAAKLSRLADARLKGRGYVVEPDRRSAIKLALEVAEPGDAVIVAGKGHEDYQLVGARVLQFDDRAVVRDIAEQMARRHS